MIYQVIYDIGKYSAVDQALRMDGSSEIGLKPELDVPTFKIRYRGESTPVRNAGQTATQSGSDPP